MNFNIALDNVYQQQEEENKKRKIKILIKEQINFSRKKNNKKRTG